MFLRGKRLKSKIRCKENMVNNTMLLRNNMLFAACLFSYLFNFALIVMILMLPHLVSALTGSYSLHSGVVSQCDTYEAADQA